MILSYPKMLESMTNENIDKDKNNEEFHAMQCCLKGTRTRVRV